MITKTKETKFCDANRCIKIWLDSLLQQSVNLGEMVRTGNEFAHKFSEINSSKVCDCNIDKSTIKYSNSVAEWKLDVSIFKEIERHMGQPILDLLDLLSRSVSRL